jgi:YggT family protein
MANIRIDPYNPAVRLLYSITDPILEPLRRYTTVGMIDLSPLVALLVLDFVRQILVSLLI